MKTYYYYFRNSRREPVVTVCLIKDGDEYSRGVSICSGKDFPSKNEGRNKSLGMAKRALGTKRTDEMVNRKDVIAYLEYLKFDSDKDLDIFDFHTDGTMIIGYRSVYMPKLTPFEKRLLG